MILMIPSRPIDRRSSNGMEKIIMKAFKASGLDLIPQRVANCRMLSVVHGHPTASQINEQLQPQMPFLSLMTVYNKIGVLGWWYRGKVAKQQAIGRFGLKAFKVLVPIFKLIDPLIPWKGLSLVIVARKPNL